MNIYFYEDDITLQDKNLIFENKYIAIDTETTGLNPIKDDLCLIQIAVADTVFIIHYQHGKKYENLSAILRNDSIVKIFHHANFDMRFLMRFCENNINNVVCTKIAAKLLLGVNSNNSLKHLLQIYLGITISKEMQLSNWDVSNLSKQQIDYAVEDVKYLPMLWDLLKDKLVVTGKMQYAQKCYDFLPTQTLLENQGFKNIFEY